MAKKLVIIESPTKAHTVQESLGPGYKVIASKGHVRDLPKSQFGIDIENGFAPHYINIRGKGDVIRGLKLEAKNASKVYLATDPDREGEAISWHLANVLGIEPDKALRVTFNELTKGVIRSAVSEPRAIDMNLVNAQQCRRILDRIVGYKLSPLLWHRLQNGLSAGRVQSVATRLIVERENEIAGFRPEEYWTVTARLEQGDIDFPVRYVGEAGADGQLIPSPKLPDGVSAKKIAASVEGGMMKVRDVKHGVRDRNPLPPFTTSTMQQEASRRLGFRSEKIMAVAQELYEGINLGPTLGGTQGLITYMRTDSLRVSDEARDNAREFILDKYGEEYNTPTPRTYRTKAGAQDAHEAIRPSDIWLEPDLAKKYLTPDQFKLYRLIWERFTASQMASAKLDTLSVEFEADGHVFRTGGYSVIFKGFTAVGGASSEAAPDGSDGQTAVDTEDEDGTSFIKNLALPEMKPGDTLGVQSITALQHFTEPPARYTEASLIRTLEEKGIGRPSTITPTITTIVGRKYVRREGKSLVPTELGISTTALMKEDFPDIVDYGFTAAREERLDGIENGTASMDALLDEFWSGFETELSAASLKQSQRKESTLEETDMICEKCGARMVIKTSRSNVRFAACPNYPRCRNTKSLIPEDGQHDKKPAAEPAKPLEYAGIKCEVCGGEMVKRNGPYGPFLACINYPNCRFSMNLEEAIDTPCPKCGGRILIRHGRRGIVFYSCEHYPNCDFSSWDMPLSDRCPECGGMLFRKKGKKGGIRCGNKECGYFKPDPEETEEKPAETGGSN